MMNNVIFAFIFMRIYSKVYFMETFDNVSIGTKWIISQQSNYTGNWSIENRTNDVIDVNTEGLVLKTESSMDAISAKTNFSFNSDIFIIQYEIKVQRHPFICGGAFIKVFNEEYEQKALSTDTRYSVMFGPDRCGKKDKIQFVLQIKNKEDGKWRKHIFTGDIPGIWDDMSHVYRLTIVRSDYFVISIDGKAKINETFSNNHFSPPLNFETLKSNDEPAIGNANDDQKHFLSHIGPVKGVGFVLHAIKANLLFDNILICDNETMANIFLLGTFVPRRRLELKRKQELLIKQKEGLTRMLKEEWKKAKEERKKKREENPEKFSLFEKFVNWSEDKLLLASSAVFLVLAFFVLLAMGCFQACKLYCRTLPGKSIENKKRNSQCKTRKIEFSRNSQPQQTEGFERGKRNKQKEFKRKPFDVLIDEEKAEEEQQCGDEDSSVSDESESFSESDASSYDSSTDKDDETVIKKDASNRKEEKNCCNKSNKKVKKL
ncbi:putative Calreticulin family [Monocercomonoides exilis]|uniref:putative Calreticulin family n=1 Tax=Monocercomonoides exilis TaxID=2049356 RepID=UPI00355A9F01|nr:putative Calreticulin family [Monocercomonoides exilis]|eukprot:MONOS_5406.1-p1 / transcript=MONOS_5406.1 / gene=MONOS_5406 / organism=Monocercomonoides_exilis_PA203 / gene_product=unspecified product / transcript_product=unspecified product / location=Mono_scaffold00156:71321-72916(+) / protein_length=488 / sequence_SO=supercontig / SO=protein_coding / is_pseudo=false